MRTGMYQTYSRSAVPSVTPVVKWLLIINIGAFILQTLHRGSYLQIFGLVPAGVLGEGYIWQLVTYMFLHGNFLHILFNMLFLWMMGSELERYWGSREFLKYYLITGVGTGGHITGCGEILKQHFPRLQVYAVEPELSPVISGGGPGPHPIQGIGPGFIPKNLHTHVLDGVID